MSQPQNTRLENVFLPAQGRKLLILHGDAIADRFYLGDEPGAQPLEEALHRIGVARGFEITLRFDRQGEPRFGSAEMADLFERVSRPLTEDRPGEATTDTFQPRARRPGAAQEELAPAVAEQANAGSMPPPLRTLIGRIERALSSERTILAIFDEPEELWRPGYETAESRDLLKQAAALARETSHPGSRLVFVVKPGRYAEFLAVLDQVSVIRGQRQILEVEPPRADEVLALLKSQMLRHGLIGDREKTARVWTERRELLVNLLDAIRGLLHSPRDDRRIEQVLETGRTRESLDAVLADLDRLVGMAALKSFLGKVRTLAQQQAAERSAGREPAPFNTHMLLLGNPGTGKTAAARIAARFLRAIGLRSSAEPVEISRENVVSAYNSGDSIVRMREHMDSAVGGVLFVDEAYQLATNEWTRGALETLMKRLEDHLETTTVILAGYEAQMQSLWSVNPGFRSRIPETNWIRFPDYTVDELLEIFMRMCARSSLEVAGAVRDRVRRFIEAEVLRGRFGNARGVRNLVEQVRIRRAEMNGTTITEAMIPEPAGYRANRVDALLAQLDDSLVGALPLKRFLRNVAARAQAAEEQGRSLEGPFHCLFVGPPGTGKTTAARRVGELFHAMGILSRGHSHEIDPSALVSPFVGEFARKVADEFNLARGGVLFIDEAHRLAVEQQGGAVLNQIVQTLTSPDFADTVVIMAGYREQMNRLVEMNPGLKGRLPYEIAFDSFDRETLASMLHRELENRDYLVGQNDAAAFGQRVAGILDAKRFDPEFANARSIKTLVQEIIDRQSQRVKATGTKEIHRVILEDLGDVLGSASDWNRRIAALDSRFVAMKPVKEEIRRLVRKSKLEQGGNRPPEKAARLLFLGNPGTGKTTAAEEMARILKEFGCLVSDRCKVVCGTDLKGPYLGHSKERVLEAFRDARGGVLFIDEAYGLASRLESVDSFSLEVIDTLVGATDLPENTRTIVILAGYTELMDRFLTVNPGLAGRFSRRVEFPNYTPLECLDILDRSFARTEQDGPPRLDAPEIRELVLAAFESITSYPDFANARDVESLRERIQDKRDERVYGDQIEPGPGSLRITREDITKGLESWLRSRFPRD